MADLPDTMRAIDPEAYGGAELLVPVVRRVPRAGAGEVLIQVAAAGVNRPDILQRQGLYPMPPGAPSILGLELAGTVVATGSGVHRWRVGDQVCALVAGGAYAEYCTAPEVQCLPIPQGLSLLEAASLPETYFTVWINLFERGFADRGETVLVHGGTSGIGVTAIQLGKAFELTMFTTCGSDEKCEAARGLGADLAINYRTQDFVDAVKAATGGRGVDILLDMVGGDYLARNIACLAENGRHISIGIQNGAVGELNLAAVLMKRLILTGSTLRARPVEYKALIADSLEREVWPLFGTGALRPVIDHVYALEEAGEAHRRMESSVHVGKVMLEIAQ